MSALEEKIDALSGQVETLLEQQRKRDELFEEMTPILKEVMAVSSDKLSDMEEKGYFAFGRGLLQVADNVVQGYSQEDVEQLAASVVGILDAVRAVTQPHVVKMISQVGDVMERAEDAKPVGVMGTIRTASKDEQVQRGMAVMLDVLRHLGQGAEKMNRREKLRRQLVARGTRPVAALPPRRRARAASSAATAPVPASTPSAAAPDLPEIPGVDFSDEGFMLDSGQWSREIAQSIANGLGVGELGEQHWTLIEFARGEYDKTGASPNIRRLSKGSGIGTKELYGMFPKSPGKCTAMIAGLPKPVGCI